MLVTILVWCQFLNVRVSVFERQVSNFEHQVSISEHGSEIDSRARFMAELASQPAWAATFPSSDAALALSLLREVKEREYCLILVYLLVYGHAMTT